VRLRSSSPSSADALARRVSHRALFKGVLGLGAAGLAASSMRSTQAALTEGTPDLFSGSLVVQGSLGLGGPALPASRLHVRSGSVHLGFYTNRVEEGFLSLAGAQSGLRLVDSTLTSWPASPQPKDALELRNVLGVLRIQSYPYGSVMSIGWDGKVTINRIPDPEVSAKLHVNGSVKIDGGLDFAGSLIVGAGTSSQSLYVRKGGVQVGLAAGPVEDGLLSLAGHAAGIRLVKAGLLSWSSPPAAGDAFRLYNANGLFKLTDANSIPLLTVGAADARVGIGLGLSPVQAKLHVNGDVRTEGSIRVGATLAIDAAGRAMQALYAE
jgi:hypothetical protein